MEIIIPNVTDIKSSSHVLGSYPGLSTAHTLSQEMLRATAPRGYVLSLTDGGHRAQGGLRTRPKPHDSQTPKPGLSLKFAFLIIMLHTALKTFLNS